MKDFKIVNDPKTSTTDSTVAAEYTIETFEALKKLPQTFPDVECKDDEKL